MKVFIEWLPTIISVIASLGGVSAILVKVGNLKEITSLRMEVKTLKKSLKESKDLNVAILERVTKIERGQRGIHDENIK